ncbi:hypothetical protein CL629_00200 [bacterium]|nr:hypothetical protein [bacterium]
MWSHLPRELERRDSYHPPRGWLSAESQLRQAKPEEKVISASFLHPNHGHARRRRPVQMAATTQGIDSMELEAFGPAVSTWRPRPLHLASTNLLALKALFSFKLVRGPEQPRPVGGECE